MKISTCCGCETKYDEIGICPECLEHCDFEDEDEEEIEADLEAQNKLETEQINKHN